VSLDPEILPPTPYDVDSEEGSRPSAGAALAIVPRGAGFLPALEPGDPMHETDRMVEEYIRASKALATQRAYLSDWKHFVGWCEKCGFAALPAAPSTVARYITYLSKPGDGAKPRKPATIIRRLTSINRMHKIEKLDSPASLNNNPGVADTLHGIQRRLGVKQQRKEPLTRERIVEVLGILDGPIAAARDKALLLIGFAGALRRSELAAMRFEDVTWHRKGITINLPRSKTDQEAKGRTIEILWGVHKQTCPVTALENWLKISQVKDGFAFRSVGRHGSIGKGLHPNSVGKLVKRLVKRTTIESPELYGGHSLRAGFVTEASANGATDLQIMKQTGHTSAEMVHRYARADQEDKQTAMSKLGL